jgi:hypothetical protein
MRLELRYGVLSYRKTLFVGQPCLQSANDFPSSDERVGNGISKSVAARRYGGD